MQQVFHELLVSWFNLVQNYGYFGVFILMALESSIVPVPSEIVMPPAAYWAAQGKMSFWGVVVAGTLGSYFGSFVSYFVSKWIGAPLIKKYGKYFLLNQKKIEMAEVWIQQYGNFGIFISRLLPVVRHLISIPAGIFKMQFLSFSFMTILGAGIWCYVLSLFGAKVLGDSPELLSSPENMVHVLKSKMHHFIIAVLILAIAYIVVLWFKNKKNRRIRSSAG